MGDALVLMLEDPVEPKALMRPYGLYYLYRRRLRQHGAQELFAAIGIVIAVALVFATLVASGSIAGSAAQVVHKVIGRADFQLRSLSPEGFDERMLSSVERLPGVKASAPLLEVPASVVAPDGRQLTVTVLGADVALGTLDGLAHTVPGAVFSERGVGLSSASAEALHIAPSNVEGSSPEHVTVKLRGGAFPLKVSAVLGHEAAGALSGVLAAAMPLETLQVLSGLKRRVSRILVQSQPGRRGQVRSGLERLAAGRVAVAPADQDIALLDQALRPGNLASTFFAAVAALIGFLFAFNAVLLTVPERREQIARLRLGGVRRTAIVQLLLFQAMCLGVVASVVGLGIGYGLALAVFNQRPGYLAQAFVLGGNVVIGWVPPLLALAGGIVAATLATMVPALDLRRGRALDAVYMDEGDPGNAVATMLGRRFALAAVLLLVLATAILLGDPSLALVACMAVALAVVLAMPLVFRAVVDGARFIARRSEHLTVLPVAVSSLRKTTLRSLALVMTGSVALFGAVALGGARGDLLSGLTKLPEANIADGDLWILNPEDIMETTPFRAQHYGAQIEHVPGVAAVHMFQSQFIDLGNRRVLVQARPTGAGEGIVRSQLVRGNPATVLAELRAGGSAIAYTQIAAEQHARIGGELSLPTPTGIAHLRLAATTTNFGWAGGAIFMNTRDFSRLWGTNAPTALVATLKPGINVERTRHVVAAALGTTSGLEVMTANTWAQRFLVLANEGLSQLQWISLMLVVAAVLAMAAALAADVWQQRPWLSGLRLGAIPSYRLRRIMLMKSALTLGAGCVGGALGGVYGQVILDAYLKHVTGFPVVTLASGWRQLEIFAIVIAAALLVAAVPIWLTSRVPLAVALEGE